MMVVERGWWWWWHEPCYETHTQGKGWGERWEHKAEGMREGQGFGDCAAHYGDIKQGSATSQSALH